MSRHMTAVFTATAILVPALATTTNAAPSLSSNTRTMKASTLPSAFTPSQADCDLDNNGVVDVQDMVKVIEVYGSDCSEEPCDVDVNRDGTVDLNDLLVMLSNYGVLPAGPTVQSSLSGVSVVLQSRFSEEASALDSIGVQNDCWMVHGYAVGMSKNTTEEMFFNASRARIEFEFGRYLSRKADLASDYDGLLILDMETPFHPRELGKYIDPASDDYDPLKFDAIIEGYKMRIDVVRTMAPSCKLGLYGFPTPHAHGKADGNAELQRTLGYEFAAAQGALDQIDVICPVLYQRFGASDNHYNRIEGYMQVGIDTGRSLLRTDGTALEVQPLLSFKIFNGSSAHHKELVPIEDLANQIDKLHSEGVENFMFWNGGDQINDTTTVIERMSELKEELDSRQNTMMVANAG